MNDKALFELIGSTVAPAMAAAGLTGVGLVRNFQPRQQGRDTQPAVYFFKVTGKRYGWPKRADVWDSNAGQFVHTEAQLYESTYQFSALIPQNPSDTTQLTEFDVLAVVSSIMQSDATIAAFRAQGVGIQRVTDVRNPYFVDDRDRYEANPSFDIVLTDYRNLVDTLPAVTTYDANVSRV